MARPESETTGFELSHEMRATEASLIKRERKRQYLFISIATYVLLLVTGGGFLGWVYTGDPSFLIVGVIGLGFLIVNEVITSSLDGLVSSVDRLTHSPDAVRERESED